MTFTSPLSRRGGKKPSKKQLSKKRSLRHLKKIALELSIKNNEAQIKICTEVDMLCRTISKIDLKARQTNDLELSLLGDRLRRVTLEFEKVFELLKPSVSSGVVQRLGYGPIELNKARN